MDAVLEQLRIDIDDEFKTRVPHIRDSWAETISQQVTVTGFKVGSGNFP
jgi:hypothetical protein